MNKAEAIRRIAALERSVADLLKQVNTLNAKTENLRPASGDYCAVDLVRCANCGEIHPYIADWEPRSRQHNCKPDDLEEERPDILYAVFNEKGDGVEGPHQSLDLMLGALPEEGYTIVQCRKPSGVLALYRGDGIRWNLVKAQPSKKVTKR